MVSANYRHLYDDDRISKNLIDEFKDFDEFKGNKIPPRLLLALSNMGVNKLEDLSNMKKHSFENIPNFGAKSMNQLECIMKKRGISFAKDTRIAITSKMVKTAAKIIRSSPFVNMGEDYSEALARKVLEAVRLEIVDE